MTTVNQGSELLKEVWEINLFQLEGCIEDCYDLPKDKGFITITSSIDTTKLPELYTLIYITGNNPIDQNENIRNNPIIDLSDIPRIKAILRDMCSKGYLVKGNYLIPINNI